MKRFWALMALLALFAALASCAGTKALMMTAPTNAKPIPAYPPLKAVSQAQWIGQERAMTLSLLETHIYGKPPAKAQSQMNGIDLIEPAAFNSSARVEEHSFTLRLNGQNKDFKLVVLTPAAATGPVPIIMMQNFCANHNVVPLEGLSLPVNPYFDCDSDSALSGVFTYVFGRYITTPPIEYIMQRGYGLAVMHPPEFVPDNAQTATPFLTAMSEVDQSEGQGQRWGAIGAWAWQASEVAKSLRADPRFSHVISYGHSRYGKSALLAGAYSNDIDAVIAHQSGTGGASLNRDKPGETIEDITQSYPHWFAPKYSEYAKDQSALPIDQHGLLALIAPKPILLGNARRDVWSDPEGAFRAALGANNIYALYGSGGLTAQSLTEFKPADDIAFWIRPGTHGVVKEDWPAFLQFLDAHFKP